ncbi:MAG: hypothetical protein C5B43_00250 [Verrucomicrobia bacterium]|nr:MAG: hypothetical protein C5B43_00250 [Verrucomicrobiota bacterium]
MGKLAVLFKDDEKFYHNNCFNFSDVEDGVKSFMLRNTVIENENGIFFCSLQNIYPFKIKIVKIFQINSFQRKKIEKGNEENQLWE